MIMIISTSTEDQQQRRNAEEKSSYMYMAYVGQDVIPNGCCALGRALLRTSPGLT